MSKEASVAIRWCRMICPFEQGRLQRPLRNGLHCPVVACIAGHAEFRLAARKYPFRWSSLQVRLVEDYSHSRFPGGPSLPAQSDSADDAVDLPCAPPIGLSKGSRLRRPLNFVPHSHSSFWFFPGTSVSAKLSEPDMPSDRPVSTTCRLRLAIETLSQHMSALGANIARATARRDTCDHRPAPCPKA
jgi:hypothetical protein